MIGTMRALKFEVALLRQKTNTQDDPDFGENPQDVIDLDEDTQEDKKDLEKHSTDAIPLVSGNVLAPSVNFHPEESGYPSPDINQVKPSDE